MLLAGVRISEPVVLDLAGRLRDAAFDSTAETLEDAQASQRAVVALTISDREAILRVLDDPPKGLAGLRGVLLRSTRDVFAWACDSTRRVQAIFVVISGRPQRTSPADGARLRHLRRDCPWLSPS
jgi:hypothetical protein